MSRTIRALAALMATVLALVLGGSAASAAPSTTPDLGSGPSEVDESFSIVKIDENYAEVETEEGLLSAEFDPAAGVVTVVEPDGSECTVDVSDIPTSDGELIQLSNSFTCAMAIHVVGLIHSYGWGTALVIASAMGAAGAAVVSFIMLVGVDVFLVWAGTNC